MTTSVAPKTPRRGSKIPAKKSGAVDLVTGKAKVEYYFDPALLLTADEGFDAKQSVKTPSKARARQDLSGAFAAEVNKVLFSSRHLYLPCAIIKDLDVDDGREKATDDGAVPALVKTSDGALHKISDKNKLIQLTAPDDYVGVPDVLHLSHVTEASLLHTLRLRYKRDDIYTNAGPILISVNPYKTVSSGGKDLYGDDKMMLYKNTPSSGIAHNLDQLPPHLFQIADKAFTALMESVMTKPEPHIEEEDAPLSMEHHVGDKTPFVRNQSIIISGESGAGKTEATKIIMQYLARIAKHSEPDLSADVGDEHSATLENKVLSSNPLLESFGNAKTLRNDNSSRFGKFIEISFDTKSGLIAGASISNYLLEKTRITTQIEGERNYHIFYQLLAAAEEDLLKEFGLLEGVSAFRYLGNRTKLTSKHDASCFAETKKCLGNIGLSEEDQKVIFSVVAAVLHLGNIDFEESVNDDDSGLHSDSAEVTEDSLTSLSVACSLLSLDKNEVLKAMLSRLITVGGKTISKPQNVAQATDKRDALAKLAYSNLFLWLVQRINDTISPPSRKPPTISAGNNGFSPVPTRCEDGQLTGFIGVLDIYGFEVFDINGFEQLLINYANEKLQRHFNRHLFEVEQDLYSSEGVDWTYITFNDNRPCLELIEGANGNVGILSTLDDAWGGMGTASEKDVKFVNQLHQQFGGLGMGGKGSTRKSVNHENFFTPKFGNDRQFIIVHYAGEVKYTANGFVGKNVESLSNELKDLKSSSDIIQNIFSATLMNGNSSAESTIGAGEYNRRSTIRGISVASQFRSSLQDLVSDLEKTQPHYIRCIKPNLSKAPNAFDSGEVLRQLQYAGMMETIRIRREGYALREEHESFYQRFLLLLHPNDAASGEGIAHLVKVLSKRLNITDADWQIGHTKIFLRRELANKLELLALLRVHAAARTLIRFGRMIAQRRASKLLTMWGRFRLHMIRKYCEHRAANTIMAACRMHKQRTSYTAMGYIAVKIQSMQRRKLAVSHTQKLRDPYGDMVFKELEELYQSETLRLDEAVKSSRFQVAAEIEAKLEPLKEALEYKRPLTRSLLESMIKEVQTELDVAVSKKAYTECAPLQKKLNELTEKRINLPTIEELKEALQKAESNVAMTAKQRDFAAAASGQAAVDEARRRLEDALLAEGISDEDDKGDDDNEVLKDMEGFSSRYELESEITSIKQQVEEAISTKDFKNASILQESLDKLENLRNDYPTMDDLEAKLDTMRSELEVAIKKREFSRAERLHTDINKLQEKIDKEREQSAQIHGAAQNDAGNKNATEDNTTPTLVIESGENLQIKTRFELENQITDYGCRIADAVSSKKFQQATDLQAIQDELENLRYMLPTTAELETLILENQKEMEKVLAQKDFSKAGDINKSIESLEKDLEQEKRLHANEQNLKKKQPVPKIPSIPKSIHTSEIVSATPILSIRQFPPKSQQKLQSSNLSIQSASVVRTTVPMAQNFDMKKLTLGRQIDNNSEVSSLNSIHSIQSTPLVHSKITSSQTKVLNGVEEDKEECPVSKLRPKKPLISNVNDSILTVCQMLASKRGDAALVTGANGGLAGIITDTDITRRVVGKYLDPSKADVVSVMTSNPTCVSLTDSAMDAMGTMVENRYRHLPVIDDNGAVVGLLDIAKCLNDAISKLERAQEKSSSAADDALAQMATLQGAGGSQAAMLQQLLGPLMSQAFGGKASPTLRTLLSGRPATVVRPGTNLRDAGLVMAEARKAALVVDDMGKLVGIFGFKDMMSRAIAKELPLELTSVSTVMTPNPESVSPDSTVLEALQIMHDHKILTLPVCESNGTVVGLVDVMDVIYGCGGAEGWRSVFDSAMDIDDECDKETVVSATEADNSQIIKQSTFVTVEPPLLRVNADAPLVSNNFPRNIPTHVEIHDGVQSELGESCFHDVRSPVDAHVPVSPSLKEDIIFKVSDSDGNTHRIRCPRQMDQLLKSLASKMGNGVDESLLEVKFIDDEGDAILVTSDSCLSEAIALAQNADNQIVKLSVKIKKMLPKAGADNSKNLVILGGIGAFVTAFLIGLVAMRSKK